MKFEIKGFSNGYVITPNFFQNTIKSKIFLNINRKTKILLYSNNAIILENLWNEYKFLQTLAIDPKSRKVAYYNPFRPISMKMINYYFITEETKMQTFFVRLHKDMMQRYYNLRGYKLSVCVFNFEGVIKWNEVTKKYELMGARMANILFDKLNITPEYVHPPGKSMFGGPLPNGSFSGTLGLMETGEADISINTHIVKTSGLKNTIYLFPIDELIFNFIAPKLENYPKVSYVRILHAGIVFGVLFVFFLILLLRYQMTRVYYEYVDTNCEEEIMDWRAYVMYYL